MTWEPTRWWRAVDADGKLWCESSDEAEVRREARPGDRVERLWRRTEQEWRPVFATGGVVRSGGSPKHDEIPFPIGCDYVVRPKCPMCAGGNTATYPTTGAAAAHAEYLTQMIGAALWVAQECPAGKWHIMQVAP